MKPWSRELIKFDLLMAFPVRYYGKIVGRSGLANVHDITVHIKTIDSNYRGIVCVWSFSIFPIKNLLWKLIIALHKWLLNVVLCQSVSKLLNLMRRKLKREIFFFFFFFQLSKKLIEKKMEPHIQVFAFLNKNYIKSEILKVYITNFWTFYY